MNLEFKEQAIKDGAFELNEFEIIAEVGGGICLPGKSNYTVRISINDFHMDTPKPKESR